jgi:hypothetical protein
VVTFTPGEIEWLEWALEPMEDMWRSIVEDAVDPDPGPPPKLVGGELVGLTPWWKEDLLYRLEEQGVGIVGDSIGFPEQLSYQPVYSLAEKIRMAGRVEQVGDDFIPENENRDSEFMFADTREDDVNKVQADTFEPMESGQCFSNAVMYAMENNQGATLVHGMITNFFGQRFDHAWLEDGDTVIDPTAGSSTSKASYYENVKAEPISRYSYQEALAKCLKHEHWGPWSAARVIGMRTATGEKIAGPAWRKPNGEVLVGGQSHIEVLMTNGVGYSIVYEEAWDSGFVTDTGRYVDRNEAAAIAEAAEQAEAKGGVLDSADLPGFSWERQEEIRLPQFGEVLSMNITMTWEDETDPEWEGDLDEFFRANVDSIDQVEEDEIRMILDQNQAYVGGGGAAPMFTLRTVGEKKQAVIMPASGGTEQEFRSPSGHRVQYMYETETGQHFYMDLDTDMIIEDRYLDSYGLGANSWPASPDPAITELRNRAVKKTAEGVLDLNGVNIEKGSKVSNSEAYAGEGYAGIGNGTVEDVVPGAADGEVYVHWDDGTKTMEWGSQLRVTAETFDGGDFAQVEPGDPSGMMAYMDDSAPSSGISEDRAMTPKDHQSVDKMLTEDVRGASRRTATEDTRRCEECREPMPPEAAMCPSCGWFQGRTDFGEDWRDTRESRRTAGDNFQDYNEAYNNAVEIANSSGMEVGIENFKSPLYPGGQTFIVHRLPSEPNRQGHELRMEIVSPGSPRTAETRVANEFDFEDNTGVIPEDRGPGQADTFQLGEPPGGAGGFEDLGDSYSPDRGVDGTNVQKWFSRKADHSWQRCPTCEYTWAGTGGDPCPSCGNVETTASPMVMGEPGMDHQPGAYHPSMTGQRTAAADPREFDCDCGGVLKYEDQYEGGAYGESEPMWKCDSCGDVAFDPQETMDKKPRNASRLEAQASYPGLTRDGMPSFTWVMHGRTNDGQEAGRFESTEAYKSHSMGARTAADPYGRGDERPSNVFGYDLDPETLTPIRETLPPYEHPGPFQSGPEPSGMAPAYDESARYQEPVEVRTQGYDGESWRPGKILRELNEGALVEVYFGENPQETVRVPASDVRTAARRTAGVPEYLASLKVGDKVRYQAPGDWDFVEMTVTDIIGGTVYADDGEGGSYMFDPDDPELDADDFEGVTASRTAAGPDIEPRSAARVAMTEQRAREYAQEQATLRGEEWLILEAVDGMGGPEDFGATQGWSDLDPGWKVIDRVVGVRTANGEPVKCGDCDGTGRLDPIQSGIFLSKTAGRTVKPKMIRTAWSAESATDNIRRYADQLPMEVIAKFENMLNMGYNPDFVMGRFRQELPELRGLR